MFIFRFFGWTLRWSVALVFFLGVMAGAGYFVFDRVSQGGEHVTVPDVQKLPVAEAMVLLAQEGLEWAKPTVMVSELVPANYVLAQRPPAGKVVRTGRKIYLTISSGHEMQAAPNLVGEALQAARQKISDSKYREGTTARVSNPAPADTVLAQDPPPGQDIMTGAAIHLLVSSGLPRGPILMPDITGKSVQLVSRILDPLGVQVLPIKRIETNQEYDVVLVQSPEPGSLLTDTQVVSYEYRPSGLTPVPDARRVIELRFVGPLSWFNRPIRVDAIDASGRRIVFPPQQEYEAGDRPLYEPYRELRYTSNPFAGDLTVEFYIDGRKARSYQYMGDDPPIVTDYDDFLVTEGQT